MEEIYELTNPQKSIYLTEQYFQNTTINNICGSVLIRQKVNLKLLNTAINFFVKNNDSFKLRFKLEDTKLVQYFTKDEFYNFEVININDESQIENLAKKEVNTKFDLFNSRLFEFKLFKLPSGFGGFIINAHHIISDAATLSMLAVEIIQNYSKLLKNETIESKPYSYVDYINSENKYLKSSRFEKDKLYWDEVLDVLPDVASFIPQNTENTDTPSAKREEFPLDLALVNEIKKYCTQNHISMYNFLIGIYAIYLGKINNMEVFTIGTPVLNRTTSAEKQTAGMFINTSLLKIDISENIPFKEFLQNIATETIGMLKHQKYNYQYILNDVRQKDKSIPNLYDVLLSYQVTKATDSNLDVPYSAKWYGTDFIANSLNVHFHDIDNTGSLIVEYDYKSSKISSSEIKKMHNRIIEMFKQVLSNENIQISDFEIVTADEKEQLINTFNKTNYDYPKDKTLFELFEEQVKLTPNRTALVFGENKLTYKELNEKANSLAHYLRNHNIENNSIVGIMINRSLEMIIAILAVLKSGGAYIPIDPDYPSDRIDYVLENSNCSIVLTSRKLFDKIKIDCKKVDINLSNHSIYNLPKDNLPSISKPQDLSYLIYTSGSTGKPKGVMLTQQALVNLTYYCNNNIPYLRDREHISIVSITSVSFDIFIFETLISLQRGLKLVIANSNEQTIPSCLNSLIEKENIQAIQTTPSRMQLFYQHIKDIPKLRNLKYITLAGEPLSIVLKNNLLELTHGKIFNGYGPSETTIFSTLTDVTNQKEITIGKPLYNTQIYILDKNLKPCPIGVSGEIYIAGDGVGLGYMQNSVLTKKSFITNPFSETSPIMYKTGDTGIYKKNGEIMCQGRIDYQVKMRGLRIELEEIEKVMLDYPSIHNCVVMKKVSSKNHEFLCAYYTSDETISENELRASLRKKLPNYMIPKYFVKLDTLPYTPNGKIDKKKLPTPSLSVKHKEIVEPKTTIELEICESIKNMISNKQISIKDNFFDDLNFDSLNTMELSSYLYKYNVSIQDISDYPTVESLANKIEKNLKVSHFENTLPKIDIKNEKFNFDLSNILLTGSLGFLGMHILKELLLCDKVNSVYLLVRNKSNVNYEERFNKTLNYYFKDSLENEAKNKVKLILGDFINDNLGIEESEYKKLTKKITTAIHCGANVKHFGRFQNFMDSNVKGTQNIIDFCELSNAKLAHISTISIGGYENNPDSILSENTFNINQVFNNHVYMITKYLAEYHVLLAINNDKLKAKIFRMGNIMPRYLDNIFQTNVKDNAMFNRLKTITKLGKITKEYENVIVDFSPVDLCANAITTILQHPSEQTIYHIFNNNRISLKNLFELAKIKLKHVKQNDFIKEVQDMKSPLASYLLDDIQNSNTYLTPAVNDLTISLLKKQGFSWNNLDTNYINNLTQFFQ